jgi:hypothetical protein
MLLLLFSPLRAYVAFGGLNWVFSFSLAQTLLF